MRLDDQEESHNIEDRRSGYRGGGFDDIPNVVPGTEPKPDGYSTVTFDLGENGGTAILIS